MRKIFIIILLAILQSGCSTPTGIKANYSIQSAHYLNPDVNGKTQPVVLNFYELKSPVGFEKAPYQKLVENPGLTLGANLIDLQTEEIRPNTSLNKNYYITENTRYIGITAGFREINSTHWRKIIEVNPNKKTISIQVILESQDLIAKKIG